MMPPPGAPLFHYEYTGGAVPKQHDRGNPGSPLVHPSSGQARCCVLLGNSFLSSTADLAEYFHVVDVVELRKHRCRIRVARP